MILQMARKMALDIGSRRIGVAVSDVLCRTAQGLTVIERGKSFSEIEEIKRIVEEHQVDEIIVGIPKAMNGSLGRQAKVTKGYIKKLRKELNTSVKGWDERLTTSLAEAALAEADISRKRRKEVVDKVAAMVILQSYLDSIGSK